MNKKGFTLTELLVVIAILMVVMSGAIFGLQKIREEAKIKSLKRIKTEVEMATEVYFSDKTIYEQNLLNNKVDKICTRLYVLESSGLIDNDLINPFDNKRIPGNLCVMSSLNSEGIVEHHFEYLDDIINEYEQNN